MKKDKKKQYAVSCRKDRNHPIKYYHDKLWKLLSYYTRLRDNWICVTCGTQKIESPLMHAGHYLPAGNNPGTKYDDHNVHAQCYTCNVGCHGQRKIYRLRLVDMYGIKEVEALESRRKLPLPNEDESKKMIEYYTKKIDEMKGKNT